MLHKKFPLPSLCSANSLLAHPTPRIRNSFIVRPLSLIVYATKSHKEHRPCLGQFYSLFTPIQSLTHILSSLASTLRKKYCQRHKIPVGWVFLPKILPQQLQPDEQADSKLRPNKSNLLKFSRQGDAICQLSLSILGKTRTRGCANFLLLYVQNILWTPFFSSTLQYE